MLPEERKGQFHFRYVQGHMDCKPTKRDGELAIEWTWDGHDEVKRAQRRGLRRTNFATCTKWPSLPEHESQHPTVDQHPTKQPFGGRETLQQTLLPRECP